MFILLPPTSQPVTADDNILFGILPEFLCFLFVFLTFFRVDVSNMLARTFRPSFFFVLIIS